MQNDFCIMHRFLQSNQGVHNNTTNNLVISSHFSFNYICVKICSRNSITYYIRIYRVTATTFPAQYGLKASDVFENFKPYTVFLFFSWIQRKRIRSLFHAAVCRLQISVERHPKDHNAFPKQTKTHRDRHAWENLIKNLPTNMQSQTSKIFCIWKALFCLPTINIWACKIKWINNTGRESECA